MLSRKRRAGAKLAAMNDLPASLAHSPRLFPYALDPRSDRMSFLALRKEDYAAASFLDNRILAQHPPVDSLPWPQVAAAVESAHLVERCGFIFHIGHVGSTLLSRLIGAHPGAFSLREPMLLRTFAQARIETPTTPELQGAKFDERLTGALKLFSRTFEKNQMSIVKATSFVCELSASLMARAAAPKALMLIVSPESYLATMLGGPNSRQEAKQVAPLRLQRLHRRIGEEVWRLESMSEGEVLAMAWGCEMAALAHTACTAGKRALIMDFDRFLADPSDLLEVLLHFDLKVAPAEVSAILNGPDMRRYSKAPEHAYDAALRRDVLDQARAVHGAEIRRGLNWLAQAARFEPVRQALAMKPSRQAS